MSTRGTTDGQWIPYAEAQTRIHQNLPVEVLDPMSPEWRLAKFSSHTSMRLYRIPGTEGPSKIDLYGVEGPRKIRIVDDESGAVLDSIAIPAGTWRLSLTKID